VKSPQPFQLPYLERLSESKDQKSQNIITQGINFQKQDPINFKNEAVRLSLNGSVEVIRAKKVSAGIPDFKNLQPHKSPMLIRQRPYFNVSKFD
jgi:hypothetical protein